MDIGISAAFVHALLTMLSLFLIAGSSVEFQSLYKRIPENYLKAIPQKVVENATVESCARNCTKEVDFECKSFDFDNVNVQCHLHNHTYNEQLIGLQQTLDTDHYRTDYERLFNRVPNHVITMQHNRNIRGLTVEECARRCILEMAFKCSGFDFERRQRNCWLTDKVLQEVKGLKRRIDTDYYERKTNGPLNRFINYGYGSLQTIEGIQMHAKIVLGVNLDACAHLCLAETAFACSSFDYMFGDKSCKLSQFIAAEVHGMRTQFDTRQQVMHFELIDMQLENDKEVSGSNHFKGENLDYFYPTPYASVLGNNERTYRKVKPDTCARKCLEERDFVCRSFDYQIQKATCFLSHVTGSDAGGLYTPDGVHVHHFEMKPSLDCGGILAKESGTLASPNWPRYYSHHLNCTWTITVPKFKIVRIEIYHLDLGWQTDDACSEENDILLFIEKTDHGRSRKCIENFQTEFVSLTNEINITFTTNAENDAQGFRIFYDADWPCETTLTEDNGQFASPRWPNTYPADSNCQWSIHGPPLSKIILRLNSIELEDHTASSCRTAYDKIDIYEGNTSDSKHLKSLCSKERPTTITSSGSTILVTFISDSRVQAKGFHASYKFILYKTTTTFTTTTTTTTTLPPTTLQDDYHIIKLSKDFSNQTNTDFPSYNVSVHMAMIGEDGDGVDNGDVDTQLVATFIEPTVEDIEEGHNRNKTDAVNGETGDDIGMGTRPEISRDIVQSNKAFSSVIMGVIVSFLLMFVIMSVTLLMVCRHYRRRLPKLRQGSNVKRTGENVSLCHKPGVSEEPVLTFRGEGDISEAARLPLPGNHSPDPDVEFHNPLYNERPHSSRNAISNETHDVLIEHSEAVEPTSETHLLTEETDDDDIDVFDDIPEHSEQDTDIVRVHIDCFTTV